MMLLTNSVSLNQRIIIDTVAAATIKSTGDNAIKAAIASLTSNTLLTILLGESMGPVFDAINSLQIL